MGSSHYSEIKGFQAFLKSSNTMDHENQDSLSCLLSFPLWTYQSGWRSTVYTLLLAQIIYLLRWIAWSIWETHAKQASTSRMLLFFFCFGSSGCLQTLASSTDPTPTPCPSEELCYCSHHHGVSLPSVSPVIRNKGFTTLWTCLPEAYTLSRSLNLKRVLIWQWWLPFICWHVFLKIQRSQEKKKTKQSLMIFMLEIGAREYSED